MIYICVEMLKVYDYDGKPTINRVIRPKENGTLKEMENKVKFIIEPKPRQFKVYLHMPEMPGMPAMTQLFELNNNLEGKVFIPMSGEWQFIIEIDNKQIKENITIPMKEMKTHEHSQDTEESLINFFLCKRYYFV